MAYGKRSARDGGSGRVDSCRRIKANEDSASVKLATSTRRERAPNLPRWFVVIVLVAHSSLLAWGVYRLSPTFDEVGHMAAGVSHWQFGQFDLYRVNPPLIRMIACLPVVLQRPETDWRNWNQNPKARSEFPLGDAFITANGATSFWYFTLARWMCIPFSLLGGLVCFRWATELYGGRAGMMALCLWCFSPNILGHAQLITPDVGATALGITAFYAFWHWLRDYHWSSTYIAGVALGLAQLSKATWIILFALLPLVWLLWQKPADLWHVPREVLRRGSQLVSILVLAIIVLNVGYGMEGSFQQLRNYEFISSTLSGRPKEMTGSDATGNRFRDTLLGAVVVPLPRNYVLGIDLQKWDFETIKPCYLRGEVRRGGWWYYYLYALLVKVPLGTLVLVVLACLRSGRTSPERRTSLIQWSRRLLNCDELLLVVPIVVILVLASNQTGINKHMRYVLPILPFVFIMTSRVAGRIDWKRRRLLSTTVAVALSASIASSLFAYPHSLSYFNELSGGPRNGSFHLLSSNIAWGQDMLFLKRWLDVHPEARPVYLAAHCGFDPQVAGIEFSIPFKRPLDVQNSAFTPTAMHLPTGWYAIDANMLRGYPYLIPDGEGGKTDAHQPFFTYFQDLEPVARIGYSLFIYRIEG